MQIRLAQPEDVPALATLYRETVFAHGPQHYTPAQTAAWAAFGQDTPPFRQFILGVSTYVAEDDRGIVGFAGLGSDGHVASVYVRQDCIRQGIGSYLLGHVLSQAEDMALERLYGEASHLSLGLFLKHGFRHYATETVERGNVTFERYLVETTRPFLV